MLFCTTLWVACIVFTSDLGREEKQLLMGLTQPKTGSWRHLQIYLRRSTCSPGAQNQAELSTRKRKMLTCPYDPCPGPNPNPNTHSADDPVSWGKDRSKSSISPFEGVLDHWPTNTSLCWQHTTCHFDVKVKFQRVLFWPLIEHLPLGSWTRKQVSA